MARGRAVGRRHGDGADRRAMLGLDQHAIVVVEDQRPGIEVVDVAARPQADADDQGM